MTQFIAIPTFNRLPQLRACLTCLAEAEGLENWRARIFDDASTDYGIAALAAEHSASYETVRNPSNLGCDANNVALLRALLDAGATRIFLLDSDMIVATDVLRFIDDMFEQTDGMLSVYNSSMHAEGSWISDELVEKQSFGGAATVWDATLLRSILDEIDEVKNWDWRACAAVRARRLRICVARNSRAQHLGISGTNNSRFGELEFGTGFKVETIAQASAMAATLETLMLNQETFARRQKSAPLSIGQGRLGRLLRISPPDKTGRS